MILVKKHRIWRLHPTMSFLMLYLLNPSDFCYGSTCNSQDIENQTHIFIPLSRIHPSGHLNLWSSVQVLPSYSVLLCVPPPADQAPAFSALHWHILLSAVTHHKRFIRKRGKCCFSAPFHTVFTLDKYGTVHFEPITYFLSTILLFLYLGGVQQKQTWYFTSRYWK